MPESTTSNHAGQLTRDELAPALRETVQTFDPERMARALHPRHRAEGRPTWRKAWHSTVLAVVGVLLVTFLVAACTKVADPQACEEDLTRYGQDWAAKPVTEPKDSWPLSCRGLSDAQRETAAGNAMLRMWGGDPAGIDAPVTLTVPSVAP